MLGGPGAHPFDELPTLCRIQGLVESVEGFLRRDDRHVYGCHDLIDQGINPGAVDLSCRRAICEGGRQLLVSGVDGRHLRPEVLTDPFDSRSLVGSKLQVFEARAEQISYPVRPRTMARLVPSTVGSTWRAVLWRLWRDLFLWILGGRLRIGGARRDPEHPYQREGSEGEHAQRTNVHGFPFDFMRAKIS